VRHRAGVDWQRFETDGHPPRTQYRAILERLRDARLDGEISTREQEIEIVNSKR